LGAGYDVKKSDILGLAVRGGAVVGHVRWGETVRSPIVPDGRVDYMIGFEKLECLRWLNQMKPDGQVLVNMQEIHPVNVSSGEDAYPDEETFDKALAAATPHVHRVPGLEIAQELGNTRVLNIVLLGVLSGLMDVDPEVWELAVKGRVPAKYVDLNVEALRKGRTWMQQNA
jgi:indolepyruvate ferredoxin oxidoreductase beta subunit